MAYPADRSSTREVWEKIRALVTAAGPVSVQEIGSPPLGYLLLSEPAVSTWYQTSITERDWIPHEPADGEILTWLLETSPARALKLLDDLFWQLLIERRERELEPPPTPQEVLEATERHRIRRNARARAFAALRLRMMLRSPVSDALPNRTRVPIADEADSEPTLEEYIAMAIETGEAGALKDIARLMRHFVTRGAKPPDWPTILRSYRATWDALDELTHDWRAGQEGDAPLVSRIVAAGLDVEHVAESPRQHGITARKIVGREQRVQPSTIGKMWKQRASLLPEEGTALRK